MLALSVASVRLMYLRKKRELIREQSNVFKKEENDDIVDFLLLQVFFHTNKLGVVDMVSTSEYCELFLSMDRSHIHYWSVG